MRKSSDVKLQKINTDNNLPIKTRSSNLLCKDVEEQIQCIIPKWPSRVGYKQITSIQKLPHLRSKVRYIKYLSLNLLIIVRYNIVFYYYFSETFLHT